MVDDSYFFVIYLNISAKKQKMVKLLEHYFSNNPQIKSELRKIEAKIGELRLSFFSDNGVFSKNKIDFGSNLLVTEIIKNTTDFPNNILDVGCGYGFMGICLSKYFNCQVDLVDVNQRAVHLCEKNINLNKALAKAYVSDIYENVKGKYDLIVTNPPIRAGKNIVLRFLKEAKEYLKDNGFLWFVIRKDQGAKSIIKAIENDYKCQIVSKNKGFYIIKAENR